MEKWKKIALIVGGVLLALFVTFTAGRMSAPVKVVEKYKEVKVVDQEAIKQAVAAARTEWEKTQTTQTVIHNIYKDGVIVESTSVNTVAQKESSSYTTYNGTTDTNSSHSSTTIEKEKETYAYRPRFSLGANAGLRWDNPPSTLSVGALTYEGHAGVRIVGGLWANVTIIPQLKFAGVGLSLQF